MFLTLKLSRSCSKNLIRKFILKVGRELNEKWSFNMLNQKKFRLKSNTQKEFEDKKNLKYMKTMKISI